MNLTIPRESLVFALQLVSRAVSTRSTLPSLGGIQLSADDGRLTLRATDMELALTRSVEANVETSGSALLPGRLLADVGRSLPEGEVTMAARAEQRDVEINAGAAHFHLRTLAGEDFPRLPEFEGEVATLPALP